MYDEVNFGKYRGREMTLLEVLVEDPGWYFWAYEALAFDNYEILSTQARTLHRRATSIRIPAAQKGNDRIQYWFDGKRFSHLDFSKFRKSGATSSSVVIGDCLDLSLAWRTDGYDKQSSANLINEFRLVWFDGMPLTRKRLDAFFSNEKNFVRP